MTRRRGFNPSEVVDSQLPAAMLLYKLGYDVIPSSELSVLRGRREANVVLDPILREQIIRINQFNWKGDWQSFNEADADEAIRKLRPSTDQLKGLTATNHEIYDKLMLGATVEKSVDGDRKSFTVRYVDWDNPANNAFHAAMEVNVARTAADGTCRPDIVLFVNGIPFAVIENKATHKGIEQAVSQVIGYQNADQIPGLMHFAQMLIAVHRTDARYASVGSGKKYWMEWKEPEPPELAELVAAPLDDFGTRTIFSGGFREHRAHFQHMDEQGGRIVSEQDRVLFALCRPDRLLEFARTFTVFDAGVRKIARHQQYFAVKEALKRVTKDDGEGRRQGGVVWHTQGSGKSLTMVMLGKALAFAKDVVREPRIVIVTDRIDLDRQITDTFRACEIDTDQAASGSDLVSLLQGSSAVITTIIDKFKTAASKAKTKLHGRDIFVLIDESHRSNYGENAALMRRLLPEACYIGFTGTPLLKSEKSTLRKFGGLIHKYAIDEATADKAVVPLLYEGRLVDQRVSGPQVDDWFERLTEGLAEAQKLDLRRKMAGAQLLAQTEQSLYAKALDISEHFRRIWQGTGFKAQLVAPTRASAIKLKGFLDEIGHVSSEIIMSPPDQREGNEEVDEDSPDIVHRFWAKMMDRYGSKEAYEQSIIERFKGDGDPEILIVVSKLLTGFDAPRNTVLYLCKSLKEHGLLQAVARVNRLFENTETGESKEFGHIIDYQGLLEELDDALTTYSSFEDYSEEDVVGTLLSVADEIVKLRTLHSNVWELFDRVPNRLDIEALEQFLGDDLVRQDFYQRLRAFGKCLHIALASERTFDLFTERELADFRWDWKRFDHLRRSVRIRYQEAVSLREYETKIRSLLDRHLIASPAEVIIEEIDITRPGDIQAVLGERETSDASKADKIASATKAALTLRMDENPVLYQSLFDMLNEAISAYREKRLSEKELLAQVTSVAEEVASGKSKRTYPQSVASNPDAQAIFDSVKQHLSDQGHVNDDEIGVLSARLTDLVSTRIIVDFWKNDLAQKKLMNDLDDFLFDGLRESGVSPDPALIDGLLKDIMRVCRARFQR